MTLSEKIGQMILAGFRGLETDEKSPIIRDIRAGRVGGVVLFDRDLGLPSATRNIRSRSQVKKLIASLQKAATIPLLVAVDQEGGQVARLKKKHGFVEMPSARTLGEADDLQATGHCAGETAAALAAAGFNLNFAPVVDLDTHPQNPVIGNYGRSFSADPAVVTRHALAVIEAHRNFGIYCCLKHFPGHGSSRGDSHLGFTDVSDTWDPRELEPFRDLIRRDRADLIMTAHIFNRCLDPQFPATLSAETIAILLRAKLGFRGPVVSDDLQMKAIRDNYDLETTLELAIRAGVDILLFANNQAYEKNLAARVGAAVTRLIENKRISKERIDESCRRILELKKKRLPAGGSRR